MSDLIERDVVIDVLYKCTPFDPKGIVLLDKCEGMIRAILSTDRPAKKWIKHSGNELVVRVECPNCHKRFQFSPRFTWKCCPLCEMKMNGMVKRKGANDEQRRDTSSN